MPSPNTQHAAMFRGGDLTEGNPPPVFPHLSTQRHSTVHESNDVKPKERKHTLTVLIHVNRVGPCRSRLQIWIDFTWTNSARVLPHLGILVGGLISVWQVRQQQRLLRAIDGGGEGIMRPAVLLPQKKKGRGNQTGKSTERQVGIMFQTLSCRSSNDRCNGAPLIRHDLGQVQKLLLLIVSPLRLHTDRADTSPSPHRENELQLEQASVIADTPTHNLNIILAS